MPTTTATIVLIAIFVIAALLIALPRVLARREQHRDSDVTDREA
jgi:hypothetical protein